MEDCNNEIKVIGLDPPVSKNSGWAVSSFNGNRINLLEKFTQVLPTLEKGDFNNLESFYKQFETLIQTHKPVALIMERQLGAGFAFARAKLNEFVGVAKLCALRNNIKVVEISPNHLKMVVAGHGSAPKEKIQSNVVKTFGLSEPGPDHECDAAAFTLCYFIDNGWNGYKVKDPYTEEEIAAVKAAKLKRKKAKEEREKLKAAKNKRSPASSKK